MLCLQDAACAPGADRTPAFRLDDTLQPTNTKTPPPKTQNQMTRCSSRTPRRHPQPPFIRHRTTRMLPASLFPISDNPNPESDNTLQLTNTRRHPQPPLIRHHTTGMLPASLSHLQQQAHNPMPRCKPKTSRRHTSRQPVSGSIYAPPFFDISEPFYGPPS